ncbi:RNA polymerase sigma-70 factor, ECF subfamily [bacterium A37T11]|nr:RNA polymerase sigma-70 factor, ECF subfamily [bacterium A37T11]
MEPKEKIFIHNDQELLDGIAAGNEKAFRIIYDRYRKKVYTYALKIIKSEDLAEDILHEVFLKLWQQEQNREIADLDSYLRVVTRNYTLKVLRRKQLEAKVNKEMFCNWNEGHHETEEHIQLKETQQLLNEAINKLPAQQKLAYQLCREEGLKYEEAAERMAVSKLTVKTHMQLALRFVRTYLRKNTDIVMWIILIQILIKK